MKSGLGIVLLLLTTALTGCFETTSSDNVNPKAVYQEYQLGYDASTGRTHAFAQFSVGGPMGTSLELAQPSQVSVDGMGMSSFSFLGTYYTRDWNGAFGSGVHSWTWVDQSRTSHQNTISLSAFSVVQSPSIWFLSGTLTIAVSGTVPAGDESYEALISQDQPKGNLSAYANVRMLDANHLELSFPQLAPSQAFTNGTAKLTLSRVRRTGLQQSTEAGGSMTGTYAVAPVLVQLAI